MRKVLSLSLPEKTVAHIKTLSKKRGFASVSDYIRGLIEQDKDLISAKELLAMAKKAQREYKAGKTITADSLADLVYDRH